MSRFIPDEVVDQIRDTCNIVDIVSSYVPLKRFGPVWKCCCPFHTEKTPSFSVSPEKGMYHCFGCGASGDVFSFVMSQENIDFPMAATMLAERAGIIIPDEKGSPAQRAGRKKNADEKQRNYDIHSKIAQWFSKNLTSEPNNPVTKYFASRNIPAETAKHFQIGAAPDGWNGAMDFLKAEGYSEQDIVKSGLVSESTKKPGLFYDRFRKRLMFSIWDEQGRVVGFSGRTIDAESKGAKYVNSPETAIFKKSKVLYGLSLARTAIKEKGFVILSEGQVDTIAMHMAGFANTVAPQGTAFTEEQATMLKRYTEKVYIGFDGDAPGIKAILKSIDILLPLGLEVRVIKFPAGTDPDDILKANGPEGIAYYVNNSVDFLDFVIEKLSEKHNDGSHWWKDRVVTEALQVLLKLESSIIRSSCISELSQKLQIPEDAVRTEMSRHVDKNAVIADKRNRNKDFQRANSVQKIQETQTYYQNQNKTYHAENINPSAPTGYNQESHGDPGPADGGRVYETQVVGVDKSILSAEETLFELALGDELLGRMIETELPVDMISKTAVGEALEVMIRFTMNDEWDLAEDEIRQRLLASPSNRVEMLLTRPHNYDIKKKKKAVPDCIRTIKIYFLQKEVDELSRMIEQDDDALISYLAKRKQLLSLNKERL